VGAAGQRFGCLLRPLRRRGEQRELAKILPLGGHRPPSYEAPSRIATRPSFAGDDARRIGQCTAMERIDHGRDRRRSRDRRAGARTPEAAQLIAAFERDEIEILFQPQFAAADGALLGAEALARWRHPEQVVVGGDMLFEIAERAGLSRELSSHVARLALGEAAGWPGSLRLSLNVTAIDLAEPDFVERIASQVDRARFVPD